MQHPPVLRWRRATVFATTTCLSAALVATGATPALAAPSNPNSAVGYPTFRGDPDPLPGTGVSFDPSKSYLGTVFAKDLADGAGESPDKDFWIDRVLQRNGVGPNTWSVDDTGAGYSFDSDRNEYLFSRGRAAFLRTHKPGVLGFAGDLAYWDSIRGQDGYSISVLVDGEPVQLQEDESARKQTPSYWRSVFRAASGDLNVTEVKYITDANVLVTGLEVGSGSGADVEIRATSPLVSNVVGDEITGAFQVANNVTRVTARFSGNDMKPDGRELVGRFQVPAGGVVSTKVQLGLTTTEIPESSANYESIARGDLRSPDASYRAHVTDYNRWWADNIPFIETPEANIDKTLIYRWWLGRFNFLDANMPGNSLQFPTTIEGVLGYNNAIDLTVGLHIDDLKWLRDPSYAYGSWLSVGETSGWAGQYRDNPSDPSNWDSSHTQYITKAGWESYQVHGGPASIAGLLALYGEKDTKGQLRTMDSDGDGLLDTNWNAWTGNDADAVSFSEHWGARMDRAESAYVYAGAVSAAAAYRVAGDEENAQEMDGYAQRIKSAVLEHLWDPKEKVVKHQFVNGEGAGQLAKWKEVNNFYPYSMGLMPAAGEADYNDDYEAALSLFADADEYPIFPFFTANQADKAESGTGTNNFSVINSTVILRIYQAALRRYHSEQSGSITPEQFKKLLYWNAFAHYQGGDNRYPDQNEFWADGSAKDGGSISYRSWIHHTQLGTTNWTMIEDVAGLRPREDEKIELDPIALPGWGHFAVNNLSYHGKDLTIVWNGDGTYDNGGVPRGSSVYVDGRRVFTTDRLAHVVYEPSTGSVDVLGGDAEVVDSTAATLPKAAEVVYSDASRIPDLLAKAGRNIDPAALSTANLAADAAVETSSQQGGNAGSAVVDGETAGSIWAPDPADANPAITLDLGKAKKLDDVRLFFYQTTSSSTAAGFAEPATYRLEYLDGDTWKAIPSQARTPEIPTANLNRVQFPTVTAQKIRATFTPQPGMSVALKEIQAFDSGVPAPASSNAAPSVIASQGAARADFIELGGVVKDDGQPSGTLTTTWSVESGPNGGEVRFDDPNQISTKARFTLPGTYVLRLSATDGEKTGSDTITIDGVADNGTFNVAPDAAASASYTAGWNNLGSINDGQISFSGGSNSSVWGTWSENRPAQQWLQYDWPTAVPLKSASIAFWYDDPADSTGSNVARPAAWKLQSWDAAAGTWSDIRLADGSSFTTTRDMISEVTFADEVITSKLRAVIDANTDGRSYAGIGVTEFEAYAVDPAAIDSVDVATTVGQLPDLPKTVSVVYLDGRRADLGVVWPEVTAAQVAAESEFTATGRVIGASSDASAKVWVRRDLAPSSLTLNGTVPVAQTVNVGVPVQLPSTVTGIYNNGIRRSGLPVVWNADQLGAVDASTPGVYVVAGEATDTVNPGQTTAAKATVTVVDPDHASVDSSRLRELYDANVGRVQGSFTEASWHSFTAARDAARDILAQPFATQLAVDRAEQALRDAVAQLVEVTPEPTVIAINVVSPPNKTVYTVGEQLDLSGMTVRASVSDGTIRDVASNELSVDGFDPSKVGSQTVRLTLTASPSVSAAFQVMVVGQTAPTPTGSDPAGPGGGHGVSAPSSGNSSGGGNLAATGVDTSASLGLLALGAVAAAAGLSVAIFRRIRGRRLRS